jgi:hypothetical protein
MTSRVLRLHVVAVSHVVFFLVWAVLAARPRAVQSPAAAALAAREQRLQAESVAVNRLVEQRWAAYRAALAARRRVAPAATAPHVRVVTLPPLTTTRSS